MDNSFKNLGIKEELVLALNSVGIEKPTEIQKATIPKILENKDICAQSETGTGKTLAYLLPIFQRIEADGRFTQAIILTPTHELASQVFKQSEQLSLKSNLQVRSALIIGGTNITRQIEKLKEKPQIIIGSSGRILDLIKKKKIRAHTVKTIVIDEADRMLDEINKESIIDIIKTTLKERQLIMCSATLTKSAEETAKTIMKQPEIIKTNNKISLPNTINHVYFLEEQRNKNDTLKKIITSLDHKKAIVFINNTYNIETITNKLNYHKIKAAALFGEVQSTKRRLILEDFKAGRIQILVCSDLAARGLDIIGVNTIISMDVPEEPDKYLHRAGRCGRAGNSGLSIIIATKHEQDFIKKYEKKLNINITPVKMRQGKISG